MEQIINRSTSVRPLSQVKFGSIVLYQGKLCLWDYSPRLYPLDGSAGHQGITFGNTSSINVEVMKITRVEAEPACA